MVKTAHTVQLYRNLPDAQLRLCQGSFHCQQNGGGF